MFTGRLIAPHQHTGTEWMLTRERDAVPGGILADEPGLGKTVQTIYTICTNRNGPTLVIVPKSIKRQWIEHVREFSELTMFSFTGDGRIEPVDPTDPTDPIGPIDPAHPVYRNIVDHDVTIATYETAMRSKILPTIAFDRIVLDEAHRIRNGSTRTRRAIDKFNARIKWAITGTPLLSAPRDFRSLVNWVGVDARVGSDIQTLASTYMLRRTFEQLAGQCERLRLPPKRVHVHRVDLNVDEKRTYNEIVQYARLAIRAGDDAIRNGENRAEILQHILAIISKLQQLVVSPELIRDIVEDVTCSIFGNQRHAEAMENDTCAICMEAPDTPCQTECGHKFCEHCLVSACCVSSNCPLCRAQITMGSVAKHIDSVDTPINGTSSKLAKVAELIAAPTAKKVIVFTHFTKEAELIVDLAKSMGTPAESMTGSTSDADRSRIVDAFNTTEQKCVLVSNIAVGGVGLNLQTADTVIFASLDWTPANELQAIARAHRIGSTGCVTVHRIVANGSIDEHVLRLQDEKLKHAAVLFGDSKFHSKLGIDTSDIYNFSQLFSPIQ